MVASTGHRVQGRAEGHRGPAAGGAADRSPRRRLPRLRCVNDDRADGRTSPDGVTAMAWISGSLEPRPMAGRLIVGGPGDVDRDDHVAELLGQARDGGVDLARGERGLGVEVGPAPHRLAVLRQRDAESAAGSGGVQIPLVERDLGDERRGRDLNPRRTEPPETVFETAAFDRSATPPRARLPKGALSTRGRSRTVARRAAAETEVADDAGRGDETAHEVSSSVDHCPGTGLVCIERGGSAPRSPTEGVHVSRLRREARGRPVGAVRRHADLRPIEEVAHLAQAGHRRRLHAEAWRGPRRASGSRRPYARIARPGRGVRAA